MSQHPVWHVDGLQRGTPPHEAEVKRKDTPTAMANQKRLERMGLFPPGVERLLVLPGLPRRSALP
jgi:hypothetical protein